MARVWAAQQHGQRGFSKIVAIKTILPSLAADPQFETMFLDEARIAAMIHHPNVCEIFDLGEEGGVLYLAMEWIRGDSLARIIKPPVPGSDEAPVARRLNPRGAARIIADAAAGLHAAHELCDENGARLDVVHRDVSPQNVLVSVDGNVKVTDFGVAKALGSMQEATMAGQVKGKAAYMSPEQATGGRIDRRSDIFALGICLYEATTGVRPFAGENQLATLRSVASCTFAPPSAAVPGYPKDLEAIVMRAMSADPMRRFPTAERMQHALEEWLARSGPVVTRTQVGTLVSERIGFVVDERRTRIRDAAQVSGGRAEMPSVPDHGLPPDPPSSAGSQPSAQAVSQVAISSSFAAQGVASRTPPPHVGTPVSQAAVPRPPPGTASTVLLGVGIGLGAFVLIGGLGAASWLLLRDSGRGATASVASAPTVPAAAAVASTTPGTQPAAPDEPPAAKADPPATAPLLELVLSPVSATVHLDGKLLPAGTAHIDKPTGSAKVTLRVRAPGHAEKTVIVDGATTDPLTVTLEPEKPKEPETAPAPAPAAPAPARATPPAEPKATEPKAQEPPPKPKKKVVADIPDNPF